VVEIDGVRQLVEWNHNVLAGVELESGRKLWEFPFAHQDTNQNMPTPAYHDGLVLVGGENRGIYGVKPDKNAENWTAHAVWHQKKVALDMSSAVINDGLLYGMSHYNSGQFFCLDPETGNILWEGSPRVGDNVMFLSIPGHVVALADKGELKIIAAKGKDSEVVASYDVSDTPTWAPPVLLQNSVLVKDLQTLTRWKLR
jgi:outer membrane protein assembly factor BamB